MQFFPLQNAVSHISQGAQKASSLWDKIGGDSGKYIDFNGILSGIRNTASERGSQLALIGQKREQMIKQADIAAQAALGTELKAKLGTTGVKQDYRLQREDISSLSSFLKNLGLNDRDIQDLSDKAADGLTWGELMKGLQPQMAMSDELQGQLKDLLGRIGFSESESSEILADLGAGRFNKAWSAVKELLDQQSPGQGMMIEAKDLAVLGKVFALSDQSKAELNGVLNAFGAGELTRDQVQYFLSFLKSGVAESQRTLAEMRDVMDGRVAEASASTSALARQVSEVDAERQKKTAEAKRNIPGLREEGEESKEGASKMAQNAKASTQESVNDQETDSDAEQTPEDMGGRHELTEKSGLKKETGLENKAFVLTQNQNVPTDKNVAPNNTAPVKENFTPQNVFRQVESALLQDSGNGVHRITLELTPATLGKVLLTVHVLEGEVRATIRPQDPETTRMLNEHVHLLRQSLEQQGLKVEKIDIQTQLQEDNKDNYTWHGSDQHNEASEQHKKMQKEFTSRTILENSEHLASNMHHEDEQAKIASRSMVHIIA